MIYVVKLSTNNGDVFGTIEEDLEVNKSGVSVQLILYDEDSEWEEGFLAMSADGSKSTVIVNDQTAEALNLYWESWLKQAA